MRSACATIPKRPAGVRGENVNVLGGLTCSLFNVETRSTLWMAESRRPSSVVSNSKSHAELYRKSSSRLRYMRVETGFVRNSIKFSVPTVARLDAERHGERGSVSE